MINNGIEELVDFSAGERIAEFGTTASGWRKLHCIVKGFSADLSSALEETLHRILEAGGTEDDVYRILGAEQRQDPEENDEQCIDIDLGYVLHGEMTYFHLVDNVDDYRKYCLHWCADHGLFLEDIAEEIDMDETVGLYYRIRSFAQIKLNDAPITFLDFSNLY